MAIITTTFGCNYLQRTVVVAQQERNAIQLEELQDAPSYTAAYVKAAVKQLSQEARELRLKDQT